MSAQSRKITFNFDRHKQALEHENAALQTVLKTMSWRAKSALLATDQGLVELTDNFSPTSNTLKSSILLSFCAAFLALASAAAVMWMADVTDLAIKTSVCLSLWCVVLVLALVYFLYIVKRTKLQKACSELSHAFKKDIDNLVQQSSGLEDLDF